MIDLKSVLTKINIARVAMGREPLDELPKGDLLSAMSCPIAVALTCSVSSTEMIFNTWETAEKVAKAWQIECSDFEAFTTPPEIAEFVDAFDDEKFPELIRDNQS